MRCRVNRFPQRQGSRPVLKSAWICLGSRPDLKHSRLCSRPRPNLPLPRRQNLRGSAPRPKESQSLRSDCSPM